jgi:hypothetical protein
MVIAGERDRSVVQNRAGGDQVSVAAVSIPPPFASRLRLFARQMRGRYELARAMALPGVDAEAPGGARTYFDFFSQAEKQLMWSAASMTTRSANIVRTAGGENKSALRRRELETLQFA